MTHLSQRYYKSCYVCYYKSGWKLVTNPVSYFIRDKVDFHFKSCCYYISHWFSIQIRLILQILFFITNQGDTRALTVKSDLNPITTSKIAEMQNLVRRLNHRFMLVSQWFLLRSRYENATPNLCFNCSVNYWVSCAINKGGFFEIALVVVVDTHLPCFEALAYVLPHFDALTHVVIRVSSAFIFQTFAEVCYSVFVNRSSFKSVLNLRKAYIFKSLLKVYYRSVFNESSKAFIFQKCEHWKFTPWVTFYFGLSLHIFLWKMSATPGAYIKLGCLARRRCATK